MRFMNLIPTLAFSGIALGQEGHEFLRHSRNLADPACKKDVVVVGLGFCGVGAMYEMQKFNYFTRDNPELGLEPLDFVGLTSSQIGGRAVIARLLSGNKFNPLYPFAKEFGIVSGGETARSHKVNYNQLAVYDKDGNRKKGNDVRKVISNFYKAYDCMTERATTGLEPTTTTARKVLQECNWDPDSNEGIFPNIFEEFEVDLEMLFAAKNISLWNFPLYTYSDYQDQDLFLPLADASPPNGAGIADQIVKNKIENYMEVTKLNTAVIDIDWSEESEDLIVVETSSTDDSVCQFYHTKHVIFTPGVGVLNTRGDDEFGARMFTPELGTEFMEALRKTFIFPRDLTDTSPAAEKRRRMSLYKELFVQFGENVNLEKRYVEKKNKKKKEKIPKVNYFFIETEERRRGNIWQAYDRVPNQFYKGSKTFVGDLFTEAYESIANPITLEVDKPAAKELIKTTLNKALNLDENIINDCLFVEPFDDTTGIPQPLKLTPVTTAVQLGKDCVWQVFDVPNPGWEGAWSAFTAEDWREDYEKVLFQPLESGGGGKIWVGGEAFCIRHSGYMHGAWLSGLQQVDKMLKTTLPTVSYTAWKPSASEYNCAYGEDSNIFHDSQ